MTQMSEPVGSAEPQNSTSRFTAVASLLWTLFPLVRGLQS